MATDHELPLGSYRLPDGRAALENYRVERWRRYRRAELRALGFSEVDVGHQLDFELGAKIGQALTCGASYAAIGRSIDLSRERVRQIHQRGERIRRYRRVPFQQLTETEVRLSGRVTVVLPAQSYGAARD